jgi:hypothetical protein
VSDVDRDGHRLLVERDQTRKARLADLRRKIAEGMDAARRGDLIDGDEVFAEIRQRSESRRHR